MKAATADEVIERVLAEHRGGSAVIAFDADGTLWSGDAGEDLFGHATRARLLRQPARAELERLAAGAGLPTDGGANELGQRLFDAYVGGRFAEHTVCELMAWGFAGYAPAELGELCREVLDQTRMAERYHPSLLKILAATRAAGVRAVVVSASPRCIVEAAARPLGFAPEDVAAATPAIEGGELLPRLSEPLPYGAAKCDALRRLAADASWLASFGDNVFDLDMLCAARCGVVVRPKPRLRARLPELPELILLADDP